MSTGFDSPLLGPLAFGIFLLTWHALGPRVLQGRNRIPSPDLQDAIDTLAALLCWFYLFYPSPLFWFLVFTFMKKRITLSRPSMSQRRPQSEPITTTNLPIHALTSQFPPKDSARLLKDLLRSPILLPSIPGMQPSYQPIANPIALLDNSDTTPILCSTTDNDGRAFTMTRFDKGKQPVGNPLHTASNFKGLPVLTYDTGKQPAGTLFPTVYNFDALPISTHARQEPRLAGSASTALVLGKRKRNDQNSSCVRTQPMAVVRDVTPSVESGMASKLHTTPSVEFGMAGALGITQPEGSGKRRKVDSVVSLTSTDAVSKD